MLWARLLAYVTGTVNQELLLRDEYLAAENRILRGQIKGRLLLSETPQALRISAGSAQSSLGVWELSSSRLFPDVPGCPADFRVGLLASRSDERRITVE
jgi:putative transposase